MIKKIWVIFSFILVFSIIFSFENISIAKPVNSGSNGEVFLENLPGMKNLESEARASFKSDGDGGSAALRTYVNWIIQTSVILGSMLAVGFIIYGGIRYMTSEAFSGKTEGKEHLTNAIGGLIFLIGGYLIFLQINPNILNIDFSTASGMVKIKASEMSIGLEKIEAEIDESSSIPSNPVNSESGSIDPSGNEIAQGVARCNGQYYAKFSNTVAGDLNKKINCSTLGALDNMDNLIFNKFGHHIKLRTKCSGYSKKGDGCRSAKNSQHYYGKALDIAFPNSDWKKYGWHYYKAAKESGFTSYGFGLGNIHVDTRSGSAWWCYIDGHAVSSSQGKESKCKNVGLHHYNGAEH